MAKKEQKTQVITFRLTESEYEPFKKIFENSDLSKSEFFRHMFLTSKDNYTFEVKENKPIDYSKLLFINNKISNNINQIAKRLNTDSKSGIITQRSYNLAINNLISIESQLKRVLDKC
ncbi:plasmid mobilization protein [Photobacterium damselae]|uniref:plasmid mobilization protein n=1 Tax=Photobacterium damselae TaxID=38293 RepID=UPI0010FD6207|nr:plasmid mobilization relaxosome protein MobC [Photobacterium damselae]TLS73439.1 plasmid mobilization relaxosome protein MobC [Photobacterium damselae subsp. damselae]